MESAGVDVPVVQKNIAQVLRTSLEAEDPLLEMKLTQENLVAVIGEVFLTIQQVRENVVSNFHTEISSVLNENLVTSRFLDSTPLSNRTSVTPYDDLWIQGASLTNIASSFSAIEPLLYRWTTEENENLGIEYRKLSMKSILAIRPVFPDVNTFDALESRLSSMFALNMPLDFYLYDIIRPREMAVIKNFLT